MSQLHPDIKPFKNALAAYANHFDEHDAENEYSVEDLNTEIRTPFPEFITTHLRCEIDELMCAYHGEMEENLHAFFTDIQDLIESLNGEYTVWDSVAEDAYDVSALWLFGNWVEKEQTTLGGDRREFICDYIAELSDGGLAIYYVA